MGNRTIFGCVAAALAATVFGHAQTPPAPPGQQTFEVASVKPNRSGAKTASFGGRPGVVVVSNYTLLSIIRNVWMLQPYQIVGGPDWINTDRFDIEARAGGDAAAAGGRVIPMMRALLADRFKLAVHMETREMPIYALVLARPDGRLGPLLRRAAVDCRAIQDAARARGEQPQLPPAQPGRPQCGMNAGSGTMIATGVLIADVARNMSTEAGRLVVDRTGLSGYWDLDLKYASDQARLDGGNTAAGPSETASLFTALQEQLGLKLEPQRGPVEVLIIDAAERPVEN